MGDAVILLIRTGPSVDGRYFESMPTSIGIRYLNVKARPTVDQSRWHNIILSRPEVRKIYPVPPRRNIPCLIMHANPAHIRKHYHLNAFVTH